MWLQEDLAANLLAFLADEKAPHPFYTRGFLLAEEEDIPGLLERARRHGNCPPNLIVKGRADHIVCDGEIRATVTTPSVAAMECIGGTGDLVTGLVTAFLAGGLPLCRAALSAARAARLLARDGRPLGWKDFMAVLAVGLIPSALIITQPDLGTTLMILLILGGMILFHGLKGYVLKTCLLAAPCAAAFMWFVGMHDYQRQRILTFLDPGNDPRGTGYHILQSRIAIGSGQLWGKGFREGTQSQLRFLPERHSDFAVAVFGEEWGFAGCVALVTLFCLFLLSIFSTAVQAKDRFGSMLVVGVFFYFFWQIFINMGMVIGLMPVVGIPLPFISYGGSATLVNFTLLGIELNVSMRRFMFKG